MFKYIKYTDVLLVKISYIVCLSIEDGCHLESDQVWNEELETGSL